MDDTLSLSSEYKLAIDAAIESNDANNLQYNFECIVSGGYSSQLKSYCNRLLYDIRAFDKALDCYKTILKYTDSPATYTNNQGRTLLHLAAFYGNLEIVKTLLEYENLEINKKTPSGCTALYLATPRGHLKILIALLSKGAEPNCVTNSGSTPLTVTANFGYLSCAELLISHGANVNYQNQAGMTPLHIAAEHGHWNLYNLFLREGGNEKLPNILGQTPEDIRKKKLSNIDKTLINTRFNSLRTPADDAKITLPGIKSRELSRESRKENISPIISKAYSDFSRTSTKLHREISDNKSLVNVLVKSKSSEKFDTSSTRSSQSNQNQSENLYSHSLVYST